MVGAGRFRNGPPTQPRRVAAELACTPRGDTIDIEETARLTGVSKQKFVRMHDRGEVMHDKPVGTQRTVRRREASSTCTVSLTAPRGSDAQPGHSRTRTAAIRANPGRDGTGADGEHHDQSIASTTSMRRHRASLRLDRGVRPRPADISHEECPGDRLVLAAAGQRNASIRTRATPPARKKPAASPSACHQPRPLTMWHDFVACSGTDGTPAVELVGWDDPPPRASRPRDHLPATPPFRRSTRTTRAVVPPWLGRLSTAVIAPPLLSCNCDSSRVRERGGSVSGTVSGRRAHW
ncbi:hypothetical protein FB384_003331 [Prauserella sediminis]|uniref:Uncharacterized protein n=1 Tax=Prauserella sediminis TaxID=577680 RepID=A0A839XP24_9PSEU|nr:hypothetical protein [Prauserella sediminis]